MTLHSKWPAAALFLIATLSSSAQTRTTAGEPPRADSGTSIRSIRQSHSSAGIAPIGSGLAADDIAEDFLRRSVNERSRRVPGVPRSIKPQESVMNSIGSSLTVGTTATAAGPGWWSNWGAATGYVKLVTPVVHNESNMFSITCSDCTEPTDRRRV